MPAVTHSASTRSALASMEREIAATLRTLEKLEKEFTVKERKRIMRPGAKILQSAIAANARRSKKVHLRYNTGKVDKGIRAPKGSGNVVATYDPGNLARAIAIFNFRRSNSLHVGPKVAKGQNTYGHFSGRRVDAFYAGWIEYGTVNMRARPYIRPALAAAKGKVGKAITEAVRRKVKDFERKNKTA